MSQNENTPAENTPVETTVAPIHAELIAPVFAVITECTDRALRPDFGPDLELRLREDLNMDSLDRLDLILELETAFPIEIDDAEADRVVTVRDVVALVSSKTNAEPTD